MGEHSDPPGSPFPGARRCSTASLSGKRLGSNRGAPAPTIATGLEEEAVRLRTNRLREAEHAAVKNRLRSGMFGLIPDESYQATQAQTTRLYTTAS
jgi:hypothetical protein